MSSSQLGLDQRIEDEEERHILGHLLIESALEPGVETVGDLLSLPPQRKRALMDRARKSAGYRTISEQKAHDSFEQANAAVQTRSTFTEFPVCAAAGCKSIPLTEQGAHAKVVVRRWWCSEHAHLAAPEDFQPPPGPRYGPSGAIEFPGEREAEAARLLHQEERRKEKREAMQAERREDAEAIKRFEDAMAAKWRRERPEGLRGT